MSKVPEWLVVEKTWNFLAEKKLAQNSQKTAMFDQFATLTTYLTTSNKVGDWNAEKVHAERRWLECFDFFNSKSFGFKELLLIVEYGFALPGSNCPCERVFSLTNNVWTDDVSTINIATLKNRLFLKFNVEMNCTNFHTFISTQENLLKKVHSSEKYEKKKDGNANE